MSNVGVMDSTCRILVTTCGTPDRSLASALYVTYSAVPAESSFHPSRSEYWQNGRTAGAPLIFIFSEIEATASPSRPRQASRRPIVVFIGKLLYSRPESRES